MTEDGLRKLAERALDYFKVVTERCADYNDFGSVLGAQDEAADIYSDLVDDLRSACRRSARLIRRIELWESGNRSVCKL